ncbi:calcium-dependent protein kinase 19-like protein [Tanacetum coccineum]|uniref:Calcium-dependent protein kinase 19-like protein n=1 Tax=Tanacetum coccineum TaxID=301880 RepID=A0ABQ5BPZ0_9ASTR
MGMFLSKAKNTQTEEPAQKKPKKLERKSSSILGIEEKNVELDYKKVKEIGRGRFATTYLCKEKSTGKKFACKSVVKRFLVTESEKQNLKREVKIMEYLKGQTNVVELFDAYEDTKYVHLVMEYCEGGELYEKMESKGRFTEKIAAEIISSIMKVVCYLHFMGIMHRDLKPENFLLAKKGLIGAPCCADYTLLKAIDFGLSAYIDEEKPNQEKVGTAFYVAPEVLRRQSYGKEVDIWSAGVILYMLLTGAPPFYGDKESEIFDAVQKAEPDMDSYPWPLISENAKKLVKSMLSVDPKNRPTATAVLNDQWLKENGVAIENPIGDALLVKMKRFRAMSKFKRLALTVMMESIPREELEELRAMFQNFDADGNKVISSEELKKSFHKLGSDINKEDINMIVNNADTDGDGSISYNEFITAMMNVRREHKEEHLREAFKSFDTDGDGYVSKKELQQALETRKIGDEATINDIISEFDEHDDGQISYAEFCEMIRN